MKLEVTHESWPIAGAFTISRGSKTTAEVVVVTLTDGDHTGRGECVPYKRYDETIESVMAALQQARSAIEAGISRDDIPALLGPMAARNALDCAMWDLEAKQSGKSVAQLLGISTLKPLLTAFTLSLGTPADMAAAASSATHRPLLKLKLGAEGDVDRLHSIRKAVPMARLVIDANEGWTEATLPSLLATCRDVGVEMVEQPLPAEADQCLASIEHLVPICADESAHGLEGLPALIGKYDAINIKLDKTGGLTPAMALLRQARHHKFGIMVGCMLATSLSMAPAFHLAQEADLVDLDGPLLLRKDRSPALHYDGSLILPPPAGLWGQT